MSEKAESPWRTPSERKEEMELRQQAEAAILSGECSETWPEIWETFVSPAISKALDARDKLYVLWVKEQAMCEAQREKLRGLVEAARALDARIKAGDPEFNDPGILAAIAEAEKE